MSKRKAPDDDKGELPPSAPLPPFKDLRAHLEKLQRDGKLVKLLSKAWDSDDMKRHILTQLGGWASVSNKNEFLKYDWDVQDDEHDSESGIKLYFASNNVQLEGYNSAKNVDPKECSGGCYINCSGGCQECSGAEVFCFNMEKRLDGTTCTRLKVNSYVTCRCGGMRGEDSDHCEEMDYVALPRK